MFDQIWKICKFCTKNLPKPSHPCERRDLQKNDFWFLNKSKEGFLWGLVGLVLVIGMKQIYQQVSEEIKTNSPSQPCQLN